MTDQPSRETDLSALEPYVPRRFVPAGADLTDRATVVKLYKALLAREVSSGEALEAWVADRSELDAAVDQAGSILYIRMTCQTDDPERASRYKAFQTHVVPAIKPLGHALDAKYLAARERLGGGGRRYAVYDRTTRTQVAIFREANVPLQTDLSLLSQAYQTRCGAMTVRFDGEEQTLPQMARYQQEPDRALRERAWRATTARRLQDADALEALFDKMLAGRARVAANAGMSSFREYSFAAMNRFDYTPADCEAYHDAVEAVVVPLWREIQQQRRRRMALAALRPWDTRVDVEGRAPLKPFTEPSRLVDGCVEVFRRTDPALAEQFASMRDAGLLDLASRKGKAPGGYQATLAEARKPFIFMNAVGLDRDVRTLLHEGGHAFHTLAAADEPLLAYRHAPMEFCEVASMGMELLADGHLGVFYDDPAAGARSRREHLEGIIMILPWVATIDAFQHWIYTHPGHTAAARRDAWLAVHDRFSGGVVDWTGLDEAKGCLWHRQLHVFEAPFYYIEYGIAQLGALQLWVRAKADPAAALADYKAAMALGGSRPLPELFAAAGLRFDFSAETIGPLVEAVAAELAMLEGEGKSERSSKYETNSKRRNG